MKKLYKNRKKEIFVLLGIFFVLGLYYTSSNINRLTSKEKFKTFLANHPYNQPNTNLVQDRESEEKDRPDLAWQQDFIETMDPALGYPPVKKLKNVYQKVKEYKMLKSGIPGDGVYNWVERGPASVAGRVRALMFDPNDATGKKVWAGGVTGGLWFNNDITSSSSSWTKVNDLWDNLSIGSIAYDPNNTNIFYVGTGEDWVGSVRGDGIWKSSDGGSNWAQLASTNDNSDFYSIQKIVVGSNGRVIAGTNKDIFISDDGGSTWTNTTNAGIFVSDLEIAPDGTVYAGRGGGSNSAEGSILKSIDNGSTWTDITPASGQNRIELAIAPSNSNILYAVAAAGSNVAWMKKSTDAGISWTNISTPMYMDQSCTMSTTDDFTRGQAWYDLILAVHPTSPDTVFVGGIDVNKSTDGGQSWKTITYWTGACAPYSHADNHALVFRPGYDNELITGSDGGVSYSPDAGTASSPSFTVMNKGFNITQFYACAIHPDIRKNYYLAGAQDNGSHRFKMPGFDETTEVTGGDGVFCFIDQDNPDIQITSYVYNNYYLSKDGGNSFGELISDNSGSFINPADYDDYMNILYSYRNTTSLYRIKNIDSTPIQEILPITTIAERVTHIRVSQYTIDSTTLFVGTVSGMVYKITNADNTSYSVMNITGNSFPNGSISCIELGANENEILVTFKNYGVTSVWYTNDGGTTWTSKEGDLPDMPVRWALFNPNNRNQVIIATEVGVWSTSNFNNASPSWTPSNSGLANVRTDMLQIRQSDYQVVAATYGRGLYTSNGFSNIDDSQLGAYFSVSGSPNIFPGGNVQFEDLSTGNPTSWTWEFAGGTPATSTDQNPIVTYDSSGTYNVTLTVSDGTNTKTTTRTQYINVAESGGWTEQATAFTTASRGIDYISVVDKNIVWAKAYDGTNTDNKIKEFTKTVDGGSSWTSGTINITGNIYPAMIHAYNADTAWVPMYPDPVGTDGGIYITTDGGATWNKQSSATFTGADAFANVVYFWNKDEGFCMGDPNGGYFEIYTTTDGGNNWTRVPQANIPTPQSGEYGTVGLFCVDENDVVYFNTTKGRIFKSTDKGISWSVISTPLNGRTRIAFADEQNGIVMESGNASNAYYTTDGGQNWNKITDTDMFGSGLQYVKGTNRMYISSSANTSIGAGASYSIDGGKTWRKFDALIDKQCLSIGFADMATGWIGQFNASATQGGILKYNGSGTFADFIVSDNPETETPVKFTDNTLTNKTTSTYSWDFGQDASPATADTKGPHDVTYSTGGTKTVSLTVNGETITKDLYIITTSIEKHKADYELLVYPNPNSGAFTLRANTENAGNLFVQIFNMNGQVVYMNRFTKSSGLSEFPIQLTDVKKGVYIMKVMDGEKFDVERLIIK